MDPTNYRLYGKARSFLPGAPLEYVCSYRNFLNELVLESSEATSRVEARPRRSWSFMLSAMRCIGSGPKFTLGHDPSASVAEA